MANNKFINIFFGKAALPIWLALATYCLTELFARNPQVTETVYSQTLYPVFAFILSFLSKWFTFSVDDAFYALFVVFFTVLLILALFRKIKVGRSILMVVQTLAICYALFYWFWGFNYYRTGINNRLQIIRSKQDTIQFVKVFSNLIQQTNASYCSFEDVKYSTIDSLIEV